MTYKSLQIVCIGSIYFFLSFSLPSVGNKNNKRSCRGSAYAAVISSAESSLKAGDIICANDNLSLAKPIMVFCEESAKRIVISKSSDLTKCTSENTNIRPCTQASQTLCSNLNRGGDTAKPLLISPYGQTIVETKPSLKWHPIQNATRYVIHIWDSHSERFFSTITPQMSWPGEESALVKGSTYQVAIRAYDKIKLLRTNYAILALLTSEDSKKVISSLLSIEKIVNPEERILLTFSTYNNFDLVNDKIMYLESVKLRYNLPIIHRLLGYTYELAGFTGKAIYEYRQAILLADKFKDIPEKIASEEALIRL